MKVKLTSVDPWACQVRIVVKTLPAIVGRVPEADVCIPDQWLSRVHCQLYERDGSLAVRDLGSKHGTFVNGLRVDETIVLPGNRISLGTTTLNVEYKRRSAKTPTPVDSQAETIQKPEQTLGELGNIEAEDAESPSRSPLPDRHG
jgi:pSer/pThr/pTyr-binding forkhead associated (FHA) protein